YDNPADGVNAWENRKDNVALTISFHDVDICGLQEVLDHQLKYLAEMLPEYDWIGVGRDDGVKKGEYAPVFFRSDRLELLERGFEPRHHCRSLGRSVRL
ncbi:MAG: endonuclease, partial [Candidatus Aminicenantes bacterium]|nr:endonuclease [Candidatus Aminicenantes bacterium]